MNNEDSFNDSDELISLYSSKKVKETFINQLKKIVSNSSSKATKEVETQEKALNGELKKKNCEVGTSSESPPIKTSQRMGLRQKSKESIIEVNLTCDSPPRKHSKKSSKRGKRNKKQNEVPLEVIVLDDSLESENPEEEDLNPEVSVKVIWKSVNVKKFKIRKFQKFSKIFELLSREENIPEDKIMLTFKNMKVHRKDTPESLNLQVYDFLDGGVLSELTNSYESNVFSVDNGDKISLKFQDFKKNVVEIKMDRKEKMKVGMIQCSEQLEIPIEKIKFYFDGELIEPSQTPESLDLENDEIIDIKICN